MGCKYDQLSDIWTWFQSNRWAMFAFLVVVGFMVAGHYPNPFTIQEMVKNGTFGSIDPIYYAYLGGNLVMYILGLVVQYRHKRNNPAKTDFEERMVYKNLKYRRR